MFSTRSIYRTAPATEWLPASSGLVICGHGVRGGPGSAPRHAATIARLGRFAEVRVCCLNGRPCLEEVLSRMRTQSIYIVPLLMAEGYTAQRRLADALDDDAEDGKQVVVCRPVGVNPRLSDLIAASARRTCRDRGWAPGDCALIVMAHGTPRSAAAAATAIEHAARIARRQDFAEVATAFLDEAPSLPEALRSMASRYCVVVGLFADRGVHGEGDVLRLLSDWGGAAAYAGPVGIMPEIAALILEQVDALQAGESPRH